MATELVAHGGQELIGELRLAARGEALVERRAQDRCRHTFVNRGGDRPAPFAGIGDASRELGEPGVGNQRSGREIQEPGPYDAAAAPDFGDVGKV